MPAGRRPRLAVAERRAALLGAVADRPVMASRERRVAAALGRMWSSAAVRVAEAGALVAAADPIRVSDAASARDADEAARTITAEQAGAVLAEAQRYAVAAQVSWSLVNPLATAVISRLGQRIAHVTDAERARIMAVLGEAYRDGLSVRDAARLLEADGALGRARALAVARTEMNAASNLASLAVVRAGNYEALRAGEAPLFTHKRWVAALDGRTRPSHAAANGQRVPVDGVFLVGSARLDAPHDPTGPAEEIVNCRCTLTYVEDGG